MARPIVITGGGTGGHVFPMQAVAEALMARGVAPERLRYVGSRRGLEASALASGPVALTLLPGRGLRRSLSPRAWWANVGAVVTLALALGRAVLLVGRWRPAAVVSVGGYASAAVALAAGLWRRPLVVVELDAAPGMAQRAVRRFTTRRCVAFDDPDPEAVHTGAPVRAAILAVDRSSSARRHARRALEPPIGDERTVVVVMSGSLGARSVNDAVVELAARWTHRADLTLIHVTGRRDAERVAARRPPAAELDYRVVDFADMAELWGVADVAVCRAGATTIAELTVLGVPAVLVPLPHAPGDHQTRNARAVAQAGGARVLGDAQCTGAALERALEEITVPAVAERMSVAAASRAHRGAAAAIADVVLGVEDSS